MAPRPGAEERCELTHLRPTESDAARADDDVAVEFQPFPLEYQHSEGDETQACREKRPWQRVSIRERPCQDDESEDVHQPESRDSSASRQVDRRAEVAAVGREVRDALNLGFVLDAYCICPGERNSTRPGSEERDAGYGQPAESAAGEFLGRYFLKRARASSHWRSRSLKSCSDFSFFTPSRASCICSAAFALSPVWKSAQP